MPVSGYDGSIWDLGAVLTCGARLLDLACMGFPAGSSLSDHFGPLPACTPPAQLPDGAGTAPGVQRRRAPGAPARECGLAPPGRPGPLRAGRPAMASGTVAIGSPSAVGRGVHGDPGDAALLAPAAGHAQVGLHQPPSSRRPSTAAAIRKLVIRMATENPHGGAAGCRANWSGSATRSLPPRCGRSCTTPGSIPRPAAPARKASARSLLMQGSPQAGGYPKAPPSGFPRPRRTGLPSA